MAAVKGYLAAALIGAAFLTASAQNATTMDRGNAEIAPVLQLHGSGTTNPSKLLWKVMDDLTVRAKLPVRLTYRAVGSSTGVAEFVGEGAGLAPLNNFGAGDIPIDAEKYKALTDAGHKIFHMPFVMGAISFFHSIPSDLDLDLSACLLAKIFSLEITTWDDAEILGYKTNSQLKSVLTGKTIKVVRRVHGSSSTTIATKYLRQACPASWPDTLTGKGAAGADGKPSKAPFWGEGTFKGEGSGGVASFLKTNEFAIGYLDAGHGIKEGLNEVAIANANGKMVKSSTADKSAAALESKTIPAALDADWSAASLLDAPGDNSWPMMTFSYFYIRQDMHAMGESGALVQALVKYMYSTEGQAHLAEFGFVSVPKEIVDKAVAAIETVALAPGVVEWAFETEGTTQKYVGQMDHIFSGKRGNYNSYLLDHVTDDVQFLIQQLQKDVATLKASSTGSGKSIGSQDDDDDDTDGPVATTALVLVILCVLGLVAQAVTIQSLQHKVNVLEKLDNMKYDTASLGSQKSGQSTGSRVGLVTNSLNV